MVVVAVAAVAVAGVAAAVFLGVEAAAATPEAAAVSPEVVIVVFPGLEEETFREEVSARPLGLREILIDPISEDLLPGISPATEAAAVWSLLEERPRATGLQVKGWAIAPLSYPHPRASIAAEPIGLLAVASASGLPSPVQARAKASPIDRVARTVQATETWEIS
ncbi:MAG: hypothetical protein JO333_21450 [Verrucomicrobia bacterium]|nr:hypothetical protein [Verrucomicrobiota bacterium]